MTVTHCWMQITAGQGPDECCLAVRKVSELILQDAKQQALKAELLEAVGGDRADTWASALISVQGNALETFINEWAGVVQWICESPFRPGHKRKNWFVGVNIITPPTMTQSRVEVRDVIFEAMRASGPGGQHVNVTNSAVRATHRLTGLTVVAREERSQYMNKKLALARLMLQLEEKNREAISSNMQEKWSKHKEVKRGNPVRVFVGKEFLEKKRS